MNAERIKVALGIDVAELHAAIDEVNHLIDLMKQANQLIDQLSKRKYDFTITVDAQAEDGSP